jgi:IclR family mhp operon transcriptional activator
MGASTWQSALTGISIDHLSVNRESKTVMGSTRPIRALLRGLEVLHVLNLHNGATVSEVAAEIGLPRTTTYRVLETLCVAGYAYRAASDDRYRLTIMVRGLSDGFDDEAWVTQIARPYMHELCRDIIWPVAIATLSGSSMLIRQTTDHESPLAVEKRGPGFRVPILGSASGIAYLAFCPKEQRDTLLEILEKSKRATDALARDRKKVFKALLETRQRGYAVSRRPRRISDELSFSVPIMANERVLAALTIRCSSTAVPEAEARLRFVPKLRTTAEKICRDFIAMGKETPLASGASQAGS